MKGLIISGGNPPSKALLNSELQLKPYVICADSGGDCLYKYRIIPDLLIGDFDSISEEAFRYFEKSSCRIIKLPKEKDFTDTEFALKECIKKGLSEITFLGCTGTRLDHTLGNISLLIICLENNIKGNIKDINNDISITDSPIEINGYFGETFSLLPYTEVVSGLTLEGCKYPLKDYCLKIGNPITISNEFLDTSVRISFKSGIIIIFLSKD